MRQVAMEVDSVEEAFSELLSFVDDVYNYLGIELPEFFDADDEMVKVVEAIRDNRNGIQKPQN